MKGSSVMYENTLYQGGPGIKGGAATVFTED